MKKSLCLFGLFVFTMLQAFAQEFDIRKVELTADKVILHYDLIDTTKGHIYTIRLYSSRDSYSTPIKKVSGDVGLEINPGLNKKIVWASKEELGPSFTGEIDLEIRGRVYIPFIRFDGFENIRFFKRGVAKQITWTGGSRQNILNFDLYRGNTLVWTKPGVANDPHKLELIIPTNVGAGSDYHFRVSDNKNKDQEVRTSTFQIKRKVPLVVKFAAAVLVGVIVYKSIPEKEIEVERPPGPPTN